MRLVDSASCLLATRVALVQIQYHNHTVCQVQWGKLFSEHALYSVHIQAMTYCIIADTNEGASQHYKELLGPSMRLVDSASCLLATRVALVQIQYHNHTVCQVQWGRIIYEITTCNINSFLNYNVLRNSDVPLFVPLEHELRSM